MEGGLALTGLLLRNSAYVTIIGIHEGFTLIEIFSSQQPS